MSTELELELELELDMLTMAEIGSLLCIYYVPTKVCIPKLLLEGEICPHDALLSIASLL